MKKVNLKSDYPITIALIDELKTIFSNEKWKCPKINPVIYFSDEIFLIPQEKV